MRLLNSQEFLHRVEPEAASQSIQRVFFIGDRVRLQFHLHLEAVLDIAEEPIGTAQRRGLLGGKRFRPDQDRQRAQGAAVA